MECIGKVAAFLLLLLSPVQWQVGQRSFAPSTPSCTSELPTAVSNLVIWISADCYTHSSGCQAVPSGTLSTSWYDQSTTSYDWEVEGTCTGVSNVINGKPAVQFDGSTCYFLASSGLPLPSTTASAFIVFANADTSEKHTMIGGNGHSPAYWSCATGSGPYEQGLDSDDIAQLGTGTAACDTNWHQIDYVYQQNASLTFHIDGSNDPAQSVNDTIAFAQPPATIGENFAISGEKMHGYIAEVFMYNAAVAPTDVSKLECYLKNKYGI